MNSITKKRTGKESYKCFVCGSLFHRKKSQVDKLVDKRLTCSRVCSNEKKSLMHLEKIETRLGIKSFEKWLECKYHAEKMNVRDIAEIVYDNRKNSPSILGWMKRFGIKSRDRSEAVALQWVDNDERRKQQAEHVKVHIGAGTPARIRLIEVMQTKEYRRKASNVKLGELNPMWNPELTTNDRKDRSHCSLNARWVREVKRRDDKTCRCCGLSGVNIVAHHLNGFHWDVDNRYVVENGVTLCESCHKKFHKQYGNSNNTREQYVVFEAEMKAEGSKQLSIL